MNQYVSQFPSGSVAATDLADWMLAHGVGAMTTEEVAYLIGVPANQVPQRMATPRRKAHIFSPARGLWVPISPEYRTWGAPDPITYIDDMMAFANLDYCVGWLTSAARLGASHHAVQVFQVAVSRSVRDRAFGRSKLEFYARSNVGVYSTIPPVSVGAKARIASAGTTMLMVAEDITISGGLDNVCTVVCELADANPGFAASLGTDAPLFSAAATRRVGWILDEFGPGAPHELKDFCERLTEAVSYLSPLDMRAGKLDGRWNLIINREVEPEL